MNDDYKTVLKIELIAQLKFRNIEVPDGPVIDSEMKRAIGEINRCRRFIPTDSQPYDKKYEDMIVPLCMFSLARVGIEGETSHSENGIQRIYAGDSDYPQDLLSKIVPLAK